MATRSICRATPFSTSILNITPRIVARHFSFSPAALAPRQGGQNKEKLAKEKARKKRKKHAMYKQYDLKELEQFSLCDAMRFVICGVSSKSTQT